MTQYFPLYLSEVRFIKKGLSSKNERSLSRSLYKMSHLFRQAETGSCAAVCFNTGRSIHLHLLLPHTETFFAHEVLLLHVFLQLLFWVPDHSFSLFVAVAPYTVQKVHSLCSQGYRCFRSTDDHIIPSLCAHVLLDVIFFFLKQTNRALCEHPHALDILHNLYI